MATLPLHHPPVPGPRLNRLVVGALIGTACLLVMGMAMLYMNWQGQPAPPSVVDESPPPTQQRPESLRQGVRDYARLAPAVEPPPREVPPVAVLESRTTPPAPPIPPVQAGLLPSMGLPSLPATPPASSPPMDEPVRTTPAAASKPEAPARPKWGVDLKGRGEAAKLPEDNDRGTPPANKAVGLLKHAPWAIPVDPYKTLYRSSLLVGRLLNKINSDIPANTIRIVLTIPVFGGNEAMPDRWKQTTPLLDKGSIVIVKQVGKAEFGQARIPLHVEEVELPNGAVVALKGQAGDKDGAAGVPGKVNAHLGQLLLATGINAVLNLGLNAAAGTPGQNQFYQNPVQKAAEDAGQSVARDVNEYSRQVLRRPPTIEVSKDDPKYYNVTIELEENLMFHHKPTVIR